MNLIFLRHGESTDNVKELLSDKEIYWSILTKEGKKQVIDSVNNLQKDIDVMYVSPLPRTIETAHYVYEKYPYIIAQFDSDKKIDTLIHSNDDYGFRGVNNLIYVSNKFYGDFLTKQMDTMSSAIKF